MVISCVALMMTGTIAAIYLLITCSSVALPHGFRIHTALLFCHNLFNLLVKEYLLELGFFFRSSNLVALSLLLVHDLVVSNTLSRSCTPALSCCLLVDCFGNLIISLSLLIQEANASWILIADDAREIVLVAILASTMADRDHITTFVNDHILHIDLLGINGHANARKYLLWRRRVVVICITFTFVHARLVHLIRNS